MDETFGCDVGAGSARSRPGRSIPLDVFAS